VQDGSFESRELAAQFAAHSAIRRIHKVKKINDVDLELAGRDALPLRHRTLFYLAFLVENGSWCIR